MTTAETLMWYGGAAMGLAGSALFSGMETGVYTVNRVRLRVLASHSARSSAAVLERLMERPNRLLGTLLVGNNLANYAASLSIAALLSASGYDDWQQVAINAALLTPLLFIFGEVLPKDLFRANADRLTVPLAKPLLWLRRLLTPIVFLIGLIADALRALFGVPAAPLHLMHPRRVVTQLFREGAGHGAISPYQSDIVDRALRAEQLVLREVMVPWAQVTVVRQSQPPEALWSLADRVPFSRLPVVDTAGRPLGAIELDEALRHDPDESWDPADMARRLVRLDPDLGLDAALRRLQEERASMALVGEADGAPLGIVTVKDLVEPILGELDAW